ncbi:ABC transporter G family member 14, partial [Fragariocoptes setiger]
TLCVNSSSVEHSLHCIRAAQANETGCYYNSVFQFNESKDDLNNNNNNGTDSPKQWSTRKRSLQDKFINDERAQIEAYTENLSDQIQSIDPNFELVWSQLSFQVDDGPLSWSSIKRTLGIASRSTADEDFGQQKQHASVGERYVFQNLNGSIRSGEITAILGPSGAGKTSLLNALTGRHEGYRGRVDVLGGTPHRQMRMSIIPQKDYLVERLTVRENLMFASKIKNHLPDNKFNHESNVDRVVKMLNLYTCLEALAGSVSGGEHKRVSIAQELLSSPDLLVLDEPTSGLDSLNCKKLISTLQTLIESSQAGLIRPIAIVLTIHQPEVDVYYMFDRVYFMACNGRVIFEGAPQEAVDTVLRHKRMLHLCSDKSKNKNHNNKNGKTTAISSSKLSTKLLSPTSKPGATIETSTTSDNNNDDDDHCEIIYNPATYLIEIASGESGETLIDVLAQHQRDNFAHQYKKRLEYHTNSNDSNNQHKSNEIAIYTDSPKHGCNRNADVSVLPLRADTLCLDLSEDKVSVARQTDGVVNGHAVDTSSPSSCPSSLIVDRRLKANKSNAHRGHFWRHTRILTARAFKSTLRDPLLTATAATFHLVIPFLMYTVYSPRTGTVNACPMIQRDLDLVVLLSNQTSNKIFEMQEEFILSLEASTMFFLIAYSFSMCTISVASLSFPLNMHVLLKESRNSWYSLSSYLLAKSIADLPFEIIFPSVSVFLAWPMLGHPDSYMQWRMLSIALVLVLVSMISHAHGLLFGAIFMNSVQTATFMSNATTLPLVLLSGFTARIKHMPWLLQKLSWISMYKYATDAMNIIRFGFGRCPCNQQMDTYLRSTRPRMVGIPDQLRSLMSFYIDSGEAGNDSSLDYESSATDNIDTTSVDTTVSHTSTITGAPTMRNLAAMLTNGLDNLTSNLTTSVTERTTGAGDTDFSIAATAAALETTTSVDLPRKDFFNDMAEVMAKAFAYVINDNLIMLNTYCVLAAILALSLSCCDNVEALRTGAPSIACLTLRPVHGFHRARPAMSSPFTLTQSTQEYSHQSNLTVTLSTNMPDRYFRGFMIQAYDPVTGRTVGHFLPSSDSKPVGSCSATTHRNNLNKESATLVWVAPSRSSANNRRPSLRVPRPYIQIGTRVRRWWAPPDTPVTASPSSAGSQVSEPAHAPAAIPQASAQAPASAPVITQQASEAKSGDAHDQHEDDKPQSAPVGAHHRPPNTNVFHFGAGAVQASPSTGQVRFRATVVVTYEEFYTGFDSSDRSATVESGPSSSPPATKQSANGQQSQSVDNNNIDDSKNSTAPKEGNHS